MSAIACVHAIEREMLKMPQVEVPVIEHRAHRVYGREIFIRANTTLTGRIHKFSNLNVLAMGSMLIRMEDGAVHRFDAPRVVVSPPGTKRIAFAITDCVWITVHGTDKTDTDEIQDELTAESEEQYLAFCEQQKLIGA